MMRVGLDLRPTEKGFKAHVGRGTGRYATELCKRLPLLASEGSGELKLEKIYSEQLKVQPWERRLVRTLPFGRRTFESQVLYPRRIGRLNVDAIHFFSHGDAPAVSRVPHLVTVLDLIPLRFPELYRAHKPNLRFRFARYLEYRAIRSALGILAISESTRRDLEELLGVPREKIIVTPLAVSEEFTPRPQTDGDLRRFRGEKRRELGLPSDRRIILYVGGIDPRKNASFLLEVVKEVVNASPKGSEPLLLLAGGIEKDDQYPSLLAKLQRLGLQNHTRLLGYVSDEQLVELYQLSDVFLFPSLYEGFGFPVLEAMACGLPVVAGNNSSIPEVAGDAALLLPDNSLDIWTRETLALLASADAQQRRAEAGIARASQFSWDATAKKTLLAYEAFLSRSMPHGRSQGDSLTKHVVSGDAVNF